MRRKTKQVLIRNLDSDIVAAIKLKAELNGHSLEQELRESSSAQRHSHLPSGGTVSQDSRHAIQARHVEFDRLDP